MRAPKNNTVFTSGLVSREHGRLLRQLGGLVAVVTAGLLMSIAPRLLEAGIARGGLVLFGYGCYVFGIRVLLQSRRLSAPEREEAIQRLMESQDEWLSSPAEEGCQQLSSLAQAVGVSREITLPTPSWRPERELANAGGRR